MVQGLRAERLPRLKDDIRKILMVDGIRKMLCLEADAAAAPVGFPVFAGKADRLSGHVELESGLICKAGHADAAFHGLQHRGLAETGAVYHEIVVVSAESAVLFLF